MVARIAPVASIGYGGSHLNDSLPRLLALSATGCSLVNPAAKSTTAIHASIAGNTSVVPVTTGITQPGTPRNLTATMAAGWNGGNIVVVGTDQFDAVQTETITGTANTTVVGTKVFKSVTSVAHTAVGGAADGYSVGTGDKLGLGFKVAVGSTFFIGTVAGVAEAMTLDVANAGFTPTTLPDGSRDYCALAFPE